MSKKSLGLLAVLLALSVVHALSVPLQPGGVLPRDSDSGTLPHDHREETVDDPLDLAALDGHRGEVSTPPGMITGMDVTHRANPAGSSVVEAATRSPRVKRCTRYIPGSFSGHIKTNGCHVIITGSFDGSVGINGGRVTVKGTNSGFFYSA